jgi:hypothetical protein
MPTLNIPSVVVLEGFIYAHKYDWQDEVDYLFSTSATYEDSGYIKLCAHTIIAPVPVDFDINVATMAMLHKKKAAIVTAFQTQIESINKQVTELLALSAPKTSNGMEVLDAAPSSSEPVTFQPYVSGVDDDIPF